MVKKEILESFRNLNLKSYVDKSISSSELSILKTELNKHQRLEREIKDEMFKTYTANIDHLIDILARTNDINKLLDEIKQNLAEYKNIFKHFENEEEEEYIDAEKQKAFKEDMDSFDKDAAVFLTDKRYLVYKDTFYADEDNIKKSFLLLFCNDLLIIGKKEMKKYKLKNAFNFSTIKLHSENDKLIIFVDPFKFIYTKDVESARRAVDIFKVLTYKKTDEDDEPEKKEDNHEIIEYLVFTEQYDKLVNYKDSIDTDIDLKNVKIKPENLPLFLELFCNKGSRKKFFYKFLKQTLDKKIFDLDLLQSLEDYIKNLFMIFHSFVNDAKNMFVDYSQKYEKSKSGEAVFCLFVYHNINEIFDMLRHRIFGRHSTIDQADKYIDLIKDNLYFLGYDFRFMIEILDEDKRKMQEMSYEKTSDEMDMFLNQMIAEDYA